MDHESKAATSSEVDVSSSLEKNETTALKRTETGILLVPQPSDDPDDPLVGLPAVSSCGRTRLTHVSPAELEHLQEACRLGHLGLRVPARQVLGDPDRTCPPESQSILFPCPMLTRPQGARCPHPRQGIRRRAFEGHVHRFSPLHPLFRRSDALDPAQPAYR